MDKQFDINPQTKIGEMLDTYPQLEEVLLRLSPSFVKLRNPVLRRTVARIVSLRQAAEAGGVNIGILISELRKAANMDEIPVNSANPIKIQSQSQPEWILEENILITFDATDIIEKGENPMKDILTKAGLLHSDRILLLITPFIPVPIIELLNSKGYTSWSKQKGDNLIYTYIRNKEVNR